MNLKLETTRNTSGRKGAMLPMLAVVIVILLVAVFIGVDIARMHLTRSELRTANDAAARAAVESLGRTQSSSAAKSAAIDIASRNTVAGKGLTLNSSQIQLGHAVKDQATGSFNFVSGGSFRTSARVVGSRSTTSPDGPVGLLFGPLFGVDEFCVDSAAAATQTQKDIGLVLDVSGSMAGTRFEALEDSLESFLDILEDTPQSERVSLTVYETTARKIQPMTSNLSLIEDAFDDESADGATAIGLGMSTALDSVQNDPNARPFAIKTLVVMTDGNHNEGIDPEDIAALCTAANVSVFTITFEDGADQTRMKLLAESADGFHIHADTGAELEDAFEKIAKQLAVSLIE